MRLLHKHRFIPILKSKFPLLNNLISHSKNIKFHLRVGYKNACQVVVTDSATINTKVDYIQRISNYFRKTIINKPNSELQIHTMAFRGKNAVITGGASGIGMQVCKQLLIHEAARVAIIDLQDNMEEIIKLRNAYPKQSVTVFKMDVANRQGIEAIYEEILKTLGTLDIVVNIAGLFNDQDIQRTLLVNLGGMINSTLTAMSHMGKDKGGNGGIICNMSSVVGLDPIFLLPVYAATKAGIINFTRCLGNDIYFQRTGIKFITVCPGATITDMFTNFTEKILFTDMGDESYIVLDRLNKQSAADVSRCILLALEKEENGAVYIIEGKRLFPMEMKRYWRGIEKELQE